MPEYTVAAAVVLAGAAAWAGSAGLLRRRATWVTLAVFLIATIVFDGLLIATGVLRYASWSRTGLHVGTAPLEDLAFGLALCLVALSAWTVTGPRR